jgi:hypothetical protein
VEVLRSAWKKEAGIADRTDSERPWVPRRILGKSVEQFLGIGYKTPVLAVMHIDSYEMVQGFIKKLAENDDQFDG